jgi:hypothetical protein
MGTAKKNRPQKIVFATRKSDVKSSLNKGYRHG